MKLVYIAGPISKGDLAHNINQGTDAFLALLKAGIASICPMWSSYSGRSHTGDTVYPQVVSARMGVPVDLAGKVFSVAGATPDDLTHAQWLAVDFEYINRCDALLRLPGESVGAEMEVIHAEQRGIPVFKSIASVIQWAEHAKN